MCQELTGLHDARISKENKITNKINKFHLNALSIYNTF